MNIKNNIKRLIGFLQSKRFGVDVGKNIYIGKHCNLKGKKLIRLEDNVTIHPYSQIWSGGGR